MSSLSYILKNIRVTVRKSPWVFGLYLICNVIAVLVILFSHGVYQNYEVKTTQEDKIIDQSKNDDITFGDLVEYPKDENTTVYLPGGRSSVADFKKVLDLLDKKTKKGFTGFFVTYDVEYLAEYDSRGDTQFDSRLEYDAGLDKYGLYSTFLDNLGMVAGRYINQQEATQGADVIVLSDFSQDGIYNTQHLGEKIQFLGKEYEVIGVAQRMFTSIYVPFPSIPDDTPIKEISFLNDKVITTETYRNIKKAFYEVYGDYVNMPEMETIDEDNQTFYASIMMISVVLSALAGITLAILFRYIVYSRRKTLAIMRLNGCTRFKARVMYLVESLGSSSILYVLSAFGFDRFILPKLTRFFPNILEVYSKFTYLYIYAVFIGVLFVIVNIMISLQIDKQPVNMFKK